MPHEPEPQSARVSRRSLLRGAVVLAVPTALLGPASPPENGSGLPFVPAVRSESVAASVGVNVHLHFGETAYAQTDRVVAAITDLGVRHVRGRVSAQPGTRRGFRSLAHHGVQVQGVCGAFGDPQTMAEVMREVVTDFGDPTQVFSALEGINEPNNNGVPWIAETRAKTKALFIQRNAHGLQQIPLVAPALARVTSGGVEGADTRQQAAHLGDLSAYVDLGNIHVYPLGRRPSHGIDRFMACERLVAPHRRMVCSEGGYFTAMNYHGGAFPTPPEVCGIYLPRMVMEHWIRRNERFYVYELLDGYDPHDSLRQSSFGLIALSGPQPWAAWRAKPQYHALKNFISILADPGPSFSPPGMHLGLHAVHGMKSCLTAKRDGTHWLLMWRDLLSYDPLHRRRLQHPSRTVTLSFAERRGVRVYNPTRSSRPLHSFSRATRVQVPLADELLIARID